MVIAHGADALAEFSDLLAARLPRRGRFAPPQIREDIVGQAAHLGKQLALSLAVRVVARSSARSGAHMQ